MWKRKVRGQVRRSCTKKSVNHPKVFYNWFYFGVKLDKLFKYNKIIINEIKMLKGVNIFL